MAMDGGALGAYKIMAFVVISDPEHARTFYRDKLGLKLVSEELPYAMVFDVNGIMLRVGTAFKAVVPAQHTVLGWEVPDIARAVRDLQAAGVEVERFPGMKQDESGVWTAPTGAKVAWFKDPDGNILSLTQL
jgi:catechol 2,3-dioxygenase-like lactoylglutathione lyase family enzyme